MGEMRILTSYGLEELIDLPPSMVHMRAGDSKIMWDAENSDEVDAAKLQFNTLTKKNFKAYRTDKHGDKKGGPIKKFDPKAGRLIMVPGIGGG